MISPTLGNRFVRVRLRSSWLEASGVSWALMPSADGRLRLSSLICQGDIGRCQPRNRSRNELGATALVRSATIAVTGRRHRVMPATSVVPVPPRLPENGASPNENTPPSEATNQ